MQLLRSLQWLRLPVWHQCNHWQLSLQQLQLNLHRVKAARWALPNQRRLIPHKSKAVQHRPSQEWRQLRFIQRQQLARLRSRALRV